MYTLGCSALKKLTFLLSHFRIKKKTNLMSENKFYIRVMTIKANLEYLLAKQTSFSISTVGCIRVKTLDV